MASSPITSWQTDGETMETMTDFILGGSKITADGDCSHAIKRLSLLGRKAIINLYSIKRQRHYFANKGLSSQSYSFSSSHVWMWELDYKESWVLKNWCFWTVVLEKTLASPLDCKEIKPVNPKGKVKEKVTQSCLTLCDPVDYTVHGILQARLLEWVAFPFSRGSSQPRERTQVSHVAAGFLTSWATREVQTLKGSLQNYIPQRLTKGQKWSPWSFCFSVLNK